jgi:hypothetical protein
MKCSSACFVNASSTEFIGTSIAAAAAAAAASAAAASAAAAALQFVDLRIFYYKAFFSIK